MGQKTHPHGVRVGIIKGWDSKWYANKKEFGDNLVEDNKIRKYVKKKLYVAGVSCIEIERTAGKVKVKVNTAKPGVKTSGKSYQISLVLTPITLNSGTEFNNDARQKYYYDAENDKYIPCSTF